MSKQKNQKYGNLVPCLFGMHHFSDKHTEAHGQYNFVTQECDDCHRERTVSLWKIQYEGMPIQSSPKSRIRPTQPHVSHAHA